MSAAAADSAERHPLEVLAEEFVQRFRRGEQPAIEEYAARYPDLASDIRALFPTLTALEDLTPPRPARVVGGPRPGERLGDFRIVRELGRGGMGVVYEAEQESLRRTVAVKVLPPLARGDRVRWERFQREAETAARLHHTHIVPIFGTGEADGQPYFVMPLIRGVALDRVVAALADGVAAGEGPGEGGTGSGVDGVLAWLEAGGGGEPRARPAGWFAGVARAGLQVAQALAYAHAQGVLHRDVKPGNLLVDAHGQVWVTDFGLAKSLGSDALTRSTDAVGTLAYMAPEQLRGQADARTDVYGLGLVLWELAARQRAFGGRDRARALRAIVDGELPALGKVCRDAPRDLATILAKACAREPDHRYAGAEALAGDLARFLADRPIEARAVSRLEAAWRWCRRNRAVAALALATGLGVITAAVTGLVGWAVTSAALAREQQSARAARAASERAAATLALSLEAFEHVFDALCGKDWLGDEVTDPESGESVAAGRAPIAAADLALLERLLSFYARFAERHAGEATLQLETAKAQRRVGDIEARLGHAGAAEAAYRAALATLGQAEPKDARLERAFAHNQLGTLLREGGERRASREQHRLALTLLEAGAGTAQPRAARVELARTLTLLGSPPAGIEIEGGPPGQRFGLGPGSRERRPPPRPERPPVHKDELPQTHAVLQRRALGLLAELRAEEPGSVKLRLLEARSRRLLAQALAALSDPQAREEQQRAIAELRALAQEAPGSDELRLELAEALVLSSMPFAPAPPDAEAGARLRAGVELLERLTREQPQVPAFAAALAHVHYREGLLLRREDPAAAEQSLRRAYDASSAALRRMPGATGPASTLSWSAHALGGMLRRAGRMAEECTLHEEAIHELEAFAALEREQPRMLSRHWMALADAQEELGEVEAAVDARARGEALRGRR